MLILGINAYHGDVSAALVRDGELVAAVEEERFRRVKHWAGFPREAIASCLEMAGAGAAEVDRFAISRHPRANLARKALFALRRRPGLGLVRDRARNLGRVRRVSDVIAAEMRLDPQVVERRMHWVEHHPAHLASAFFVSPFEEAAVCAIDGFGDFVSTSHAVGRGRRLDVRRRVYFPHSLGLLYLAITQYLGFPRYGDEFKVMGLAPYGEPRYASALRRLIKLTPGGDFLLDLSYFRHHSDGVAMTWDEGEPTIGPVYTAKLEELLGPARGPDERIEPKHEAMAASLQLVFEETVVHVLRALQRATGLRRLCLAGGCAMNSVMNGKIRAETAFEEIYVQPAAADNGTALGAAFWVWNHLLGGPRRFVMEHGFWGPSFDDRQIAAALDGRARDIAQQACTVEKVEDDEELCGRTAEWIADGQIVGWFQGRMEWGARALGNRSILADARRSDMRETINTQDQIP